MSASTQTIRARRLRELFLVVHAVMSAEHEANWIGGVENIIAILGEGEADPSVADDRIDKARRSFYSMTRGDGSFFDFSIWRENIDDRVRANTEFSQITWAISREFESQA
ncbi:MAG: hypothetical protein Q8M11_01360 [Sulfuritalea sp.]|nr:hypothetical protein [Sulfuritalea sp.]MDP1982113.1 hypothetical protein [Sulfuritalea sp.]